MKHSLNKKSDFLFKRSILMVLLASQGVCVLISGEFYNFSEQHNVNAGVYQYFIGFVLLVLSVTILVDTVKKISPSVKNIDHYEESNNERSAQIPVGLKIVIVYFVFYGLSAEVLLMLNLSGWISAIQGKTFAYALGALSKGPLLGVAFLVASMGLVFRKNWARKLAVVALIFSVLPDARALSAAISSGTVTAAAFFISLSFIILLDLFVLYLLYRPEVTNSLSQ